ncbi:MAG TPA: aspartyl-tRNA amidotransferase [Candidatus Magasanikbacteria bacterium]|nr:MAG: hypothetical protein A2479_01905 [Candidatus Magasanikbacteria bacterium RIFOXYC2_FULL_39_8]HAT03756.1 aspartyl-tRNA amidotransferase [Candidatus Magasanikbacteria bacterium]
MSLLESLVAQQQEARKSHNKERLSVLQMALSAVKNEQIELRRELVDVDVVAVLQRLVKQIRDARQDFEIGKRQDLIDQADFEIGVLSSFLPKQLSEGEVEQIVHQIIEEIKPAGPQDFGKVMGSVMSKLKGQADGTVVQSVVRRLLSK